MSGAGDAGPVGALPGGSIGTRVENAATVAILTEAEEVDITVDPNDLEIDVFRSGGPGGRR